MTWKEARARVGLSVRVAAGKAGCSPTMLCSIETGKMKAPVKLAIKLAALYNIEVILHEFYSPTYDIREFIKSRITVDPKGTIWLLHHDPEDDDWIIDGDCTPMLGHALLSILTEPQFTSKPLGVWVAETYDNVASTEAGEVGS